LKKINGYILKRYFLKKRPKQPFIPVERHETIRRQITDVIAGQALSAREISGLVSVSEKEVYEHLEHIQKTLTKKDYILSVTPAECVKCGFVFKKREKLKKPGKCPLCRSELIHEPFFSIPK